MPKDTRKVATARSRSRMAGKKVKAVAKAKAVCRTARKKVSERQTKRRKLQQKSRAGR